MGVQTNPRMNNSGNEACGNQKLIMVFIFVICFICFQDSMGATTGKKGFKLRRMSNRLEMLRVSQND